MFGEKNQLLKSCDTVSLRGCLMMLKFTLTLSWHSSSPSLKIQPAPHTSSGSFSHCESPTNFPANCKKHMPPFRCNEFCIFSTTMVSEEWNFTNNFAGLYFEYVLALNLKIDKKKLVRKSTSYTVYQKKNFVLQNWQPQIWNNYSANTFATLDSRNFWVY